MRRWASYPNIKNSVSTANARQMRGSRHSVSCRTLLTTPVSSLATRCPIDWAAATPAVREAELLSLAQSTLHNALQLGLFENPRTKAQVSHNLQVLALSTALVRRHAPEPVYRDPTIAAEDALRTQAEQALAAITTGRLPGNKAVAAAEHGKASHLRANKFQQSRLAALDARGGLPRRKMHAPCWCTRTMDVSII
jgi:hypothetical protein